MSIAPTAPEAVTDSPRQPGEADEFKYWAFISYSQTDGAWASWLLKALEGYRVPRRLQQQGGTNVQIPKRLSPVYRDVSEEASSSDLGEALRTSLRRSRSLIVLCSPRSARSRWVNEEIEYFKSLGRGRRVLCLIVDGVPNADDPSQECFPPAVRSLARMAPHSAADGAAKSEPLRAERPWPLGCAPCRVHQDGRRRAWRWLRHAVAPSSSAPDPPCAARCLRGRGRADGRGRDLCGCRRRRGRGPGGRTDPIVARPARRVLVASRAYAR